MADTELTNKIRALRAKGSSPKEIARALGMPPARVIPLIKAIAAEADTKPADGAVVECLVSPGWSAGLTVNGHPEWPDVDPDPGTSGLVTVLVSRDAGRHKVSACTYLVDVYCLGVKNTVGPRVMDEHGLSRFTRDVFAAYPGRPLIVPIELAQHLVFGAVEYARGLGFEPAPESDFGMARSHLGHWAGPSAITFGREGKPFYVQGPRDNATPRDEDAATLGRTGQLPLHDHRIAVRHGARARIRGVRWGSPSFGEELRARRVRARLTQQELADRAGVSVRAAVHRAGQGDPAAGRLGAAVGRGARAER